MPNTALFKELGFDENTVRLVKASDERHQDTLYAVFAGPIPASTSTEEPLEVLKELFGRVREMIQQEAATLEKLQPLVEQARRLSPGFYRNSLLEYLLCKKAWFLLQQDRGHEALQQYDEALKVNLESPKAWASKGAALLQLVSIEEAFTAFDKAYMLRENLGPQKQGYLKDLLQGWSTAAALQGILYGILQRDVAVARRGAKEYLAVLEKAKAENLGEAATVHFKVSANEPGSRDLQAAIEEWELMVRLLAIKDPFKGWRALTKEISKVWPKDVSAVDAVREQRE